MPTQKSASGAKGKKPRVVGESILGSRPEIRFYGTYINILDNELSNFKFNENSKDEFMAGIQAEVWW